MGQKVGGFFHWFFVHPPPGDLQVLGSSTFQAPSAPLQNVVRHCNTSAISNESLDPMPKDLGCYGQGKGTLLFSKGDVATVREKKGYCLCINICVY